MGNKTLLIVTGASRGFGRAVAKAYCDRVRNIHAILIARSQEGLLETARQILTENAIKKTEVSISETDLGDLKDSELDIRLKNIFFRLPDDLPYRKMILINNHGSLGHVGPCIKTPSLKEMRETINLNITSALWFSKYVASFAREQLPEAETTIVNISSVVATQPFPTMALYSAGKAARDSYHTAMAMEMKDIRILNYSPGPLETYMTATLRESDDLDETLKQSFQKVLIDPKHSAEALVELLIEDTYESGAHIDYYDLHPKKNDTADTT